MKILKKLIAATLLLFLVGTLAATSYYFYVTKDVTLNKQKLCLSEQNIVLYDETGEEIKNATAGVLRQTVAYEHIPTHTVQAFIATEDRRFFTHNGFDFRRIVKAALNNLKAQSFKEGASTISQQLIKNTHLSQEKTVKRKLQEWKLTRQLEREYSKEEIMEKYLNTIYFGHSCFGINAAAEFYFGKRPEELSLADSAILAGLVKAPNHYSPFKNREKCERRKALVLSGMVTTGYITEEEKAEALATPLPIAPQTSKSHADYAQFVFDELSALSDRYGFTVGGQIEIYTYMDTEIQNVLEKVAESYTQSNKTFLTLDSKTNGFKGCVSDVGDIRRLPASVIKPLLVYAPAMELNYLSPATPILDEKVNYGGYSPENYDGTFHGYVSAREALAKSLNVPAVKTLSAIGVENAVRYLEQTGLSVNQADYSLALALGGMKEGFSLKELLSAYSVFPNGGVYSECGFISAISIDGTPVYRRTSPKTQVFSESTAYLTTDMLKSAAKIGTAKKLRSLPFDIAAKTGTVGTANGNTDAYALSFTSEHCIGVWMGNADNTRIECTGGGLPCNALLQINEKLYANKVPKSFPTPKDVVSVELDKTQYYDTHTIMLADELSPVSYRFSELFKKDNLPLKKCDSFSNPSILTPHLQYENGSVTITFDKSLPNFYQYKIQRTDYVTHTTLYFGKFIERYVDRHLSENKNYVYTVTPYYKEIAGRPIVLPTVTTKTFPSQDDDSVLKKDWWDD
ncbi:MAG: transglycosylase domain-containing protein [Clostridia bacterium]|nr:transglycosylase domain-containing protein [Clostridia bacterium]